MRIAQAHDVGPCTSTPLASAMPPSRILAPRPSTKRSPRAFRAARSAGGPLEHALRLARNNGAEPAQTRARLLPGIRSQRRGGRGYRAGAAADMPAQTRLRRVAQEAHAELEVVDRHPLVGRVDQPRRDLGVHRPHREEPVRDRAERLAQPVAVGEPRRRQIGTACAPGSLSRDERPRPRPRAAPPIGERVPPAPLEPLELVVAVAEHRAQRRLDLRLRLARAGSGSRRSPRRAPG